MVSIVKKTFSFKKWENHKFSVKTFGGVFLWFGCTRGLGNVPSVNHIGNFQPFKCCNLITTHSVGLNVTQIRLYVCVSRKTLPRLDTSVYLLDWVSLAITTTLMPVPSQGIGDRLEQIEPKLAQTKHFIFKMTKIHTAVVVAQLVQRLLPIPEVCSSNPVIGKIYWTFVYC